MSRTTTTRRVVLALALPALAGGALAIAPAASAEGCSTGAAAGVLEPLMVHVTAAHLQTSPGQQVADLLNVDDYVKAHTVLVDQMIAPAADSASGSSC